METADLRIVCGIAAVVLTVFAYKKIRWMTPQKDKRRIVAAFLLATFFVYLAIS